MLGRLILADAARGPEQRRLLFTAFDDAWTQIVPTLGASQPASAARIRLANIILSVASNQSFDAEQLARAAVEEMLKKPSRS